ncbi:MAG: inositol monophosphatase family protein [Candidatus Promineifilaceae bacterium]
MISDYVKFTEVAETAAYAAGELLHNKWGGELQIKTKGFRDWVTDADLEAQKLIAETILNQFPEHGFLTEEEAPELSGSGDIIWVIDPLDGTTNYGRQHTIFCTSIGAAERDEAGRYQIVAGAIYDPLHDEMFSAGRGLGSTRNNAPISVSSIKDIGSAVVSMDWSRSRPRRQAVLDASQRVAHQVRTMRAIGSASLALAWVACGRLDLYFNVGVGPWDAAAAKVIIEEAGGMLTDHRGQDWTLDSTTCIASNGFVHEEFMTTSKIDRWQSSP